MYGNNYLQILLSVPMKVFGTGLQTTGTQVNVFDYPAISTLPTHGLPAIQVKSKYAPIANVKKPQMDEAKENILGRGYVSERLLLLFIGNNFRRCSIKEQCHNIGFKSVLH